MALVLGVLGLAACGSSATASGGAAPGESAAAGAAGKGGGPGGGASGTSGSTGQGGSTAGAPGGSGASGSGSPPLCIPGAVVGCACAGSEMQGAQTCLPDGSGLGPCEGCPMSTGGSGGSGASGGATGQGGSGGDTQGGSAGDTQGGSAGDTQGGSGGDTQGGSGGDNQGGSAGDTQGGSAGDTQGGGAGAAGACAAEKYDGKRAPLDIVLLVDTSGSMKDANKWQSVTSAIGELMASNDFAGVGMALQLFPKAGDASASEACAAACSDCNCVMACGCNGCSCSTVNGVSMCSCSSSNAATSCVVADYATPVVPFGDLPAVAVPIDAALAKVVPEGGTPTRPALEGALLIASERAAQAPDHKQVVVLATDGEPSESLCAPNTVAAAAAVAASGAAGSPKLPTFVIGVGPSLMKLDEVALAGSAQGAFLIDTGATAKQAFIDAMNAVRVGGLGCDFLLPTPKEGVIDPKKVNVSYTIDGVTTPLLQVPDQAACAAAGGGWYYDDPKAPTRIILCPASCDAINASADKQQAIDVLLGCKTLSVIN